MPPDENAHHPAPHESQPRRAWAFSFGKAEFVIDPHSEEGYQFTLTTTGDCRGEVAKWNRRPRCPAGSRSQAS